jgi:hypothetical protein
VEIQTVPGANVTDVEQGGLNAEVVQFAATYEFLHRVGQQHEPCNGAAHTFVSKQNNVKENPQVLFEVGYRTVSVASPADSTILSNPSSPGYPATISVHSWHRSKN